MIDLVKINAELDALRNLVKAPPGPPPREGLDWKEETHRWIRPKPIVSKSQKLPAPESKPKQRRAQSENVFARLIDKVIDVGASSDSSYVADQMAIVADGITMSEVHWGAFEEGTHRKQQQLLEESMMHMNDAIRGMSKTLRLQSMSNENKKIMSKLNGALKRRREKLKGMHKENRVNLVQAKLAKMHKELDRMEEVSKTLARKRTSTPSDKKKSQVIIGNVQNTRQHLHDALDTYKTTGWRDALDHLNEVIGPTYGLHEVLNVDLDDFDMEIGMSLNPLGDQLENLRVELGTETISRPVDRHNVSTLGEPLKTATDLLANWDDFDPQLKGGFKSMVSDSFKRSAKESIKMIGVMLKPDFQRPLQESLHRRRIEVYGSDEDWDKKVRIKYEGVPSSVFFTGGYNGGNVGAYATDLGIRTPERSSTHTLIHEIGHQIDIYDSLNEEGSRRLKNMMSRRAKNMTNAELRKSAVTAYATANVNEYFAECFATYITNPVKLYTQDPQAFAILQDEYFQ